MQRVHARSSFGRWAAVCPSSLGDDGWRNRHFVPAKSTMAETKRRKLAEAATKRRKAAMVATNQPNAAMVATNRPNAAMVAMDR